MEPISVVAASVALAAGIVKTVATIAEISVDLRDASDDLRDISNELALFQAFITPLTTGLSRFGAQSNPMLGPLLEQINSAVTGAMAVVEKIESLLVKYRGRLTLWLKLRWSLFGVDQIRKLRESLESYKVALGIGLHLMSMSVKNDTEVIREVAEVVKILQKDEILSRLVTQASPTESQAKVEQWLEKMADYTTCGETAYQATILDPDEEPARPAITSNPIPELPALSVSASDSLFDKKGQEAPVRFDNEQSESFQSGEGSIGFSSPLNNPSTTHLSTVTSSDLASTQSNDVTSISRTTLFSSFNLDIQSQAGMSESSLLTAPVPEPSIASPSPQPQTERETSQPGPLPGNSAAKTINWQPLVPSFIDELHFQNIQNATQLDMDAIQLSERRRHALSDKHREQVDAMLLRKLSQNPGSLKTKRRLFCETLLKKGASIEGSNDTSTNPLNELIVQRDWETLCLLLRYGADPNGCTLLDPRQPLAVAACNSVTCMCALILAGADIQATERSEDVCNRFCGSGREIEGRIYCAPLLSAFTAVRQKGHINIKQFWITHFLLKNGANVNFESCTTVMDFMVQRWPVASQYRMTQHFLKHGINMSSPGPKTQLQEACIVGETRLVQLLVDHGIARKNPFLGESPETDPIILAAAHQNWDCVDIVMSSATSAIHYFNLVQVFMLESPLDLSWEAFRRTVGKFRMNSHIDLSARLRWNYPRQVVDSSEHEADEENITAIELGERIFNENNRDRSQVLELLTEASVRAGLEGN
ncbi:unnamed protein product [Clonostachys chloroleuca]|uniref:Azaphilone pigments biosynthesis cluster protein L N-terminal domain-containing protein n=1 Tax=Clonostachys chloroleuca TaxID=1926264 RepID=A0AA35Q7Q0_9HYPO|nr:unnamed protein product [Clonostachys chloroleuca]